LKEYGTYSDEDHAELPYKTYPLRRFLNITVKNDGRNLATNCEIMSRLLNKSEGCQWLSIHEKPVCWDDGDIRRTIASRGKAIFHLAFSQANLTQTQKNQLGSVRCGVLDRDTQAEAWIATKKALEGPEYGDADGLCQGEFKVHVEVSTEYGHKTRSDFVIRVGDGWRTLDTEQQKCECLPKPWWHKIFHRRPNREGNQHVPKP
jgi:hypothetical protein